MHQTFISNQTYCACKFLSCYAKENIFLFWPNISSLYVGTRICFYCCLLLDYQNLMRYREENVRCKRKGACKIGACEGYFSLENSACIKHLSQIKHIVHASFCHVMLKRIFFCSGLIYLPYM